ncbi:MAG: hypothetical protein ACK487_00575 [Sphingomonadales bacterium]|jgi:hypothetical protein
MQNLLPTALLGTLFLCVSIPLQFTIAQVDGSYNQNLSDKSFNCAAGNFSVHAHTSFLTSDDFQNLFYNTHTVGNHIIYNVDRQSLTALTEIS